MRAIIKKFVRKIVLWSISDDLLAFSSEIDQVLMKHSHGLLNNVEVLDYQISLILGILKDRGIDIQEKDNLEILH